jgi:nitrate/TMAO reductase-like tetraheme cytochrome c subunit
MVEEEIMKRYWLLLLTGLALMLTGFLLSSSSTAVGQSSGTASGTVVDETGNPVPDAVVRIQDTAYMTQTDADGAFVLELPGDGPYDLTAWASGYYCVGPVEASAGQTGVQLVLIAHSAEDNPAYEWLPSQYHPGQGENQGCSQCHSHEGTDIAFTLPVDEWRLDAHSQAAVNPRFLTMYAGTDVNGNQSPATRYGTSRDYGRFPLRPDLTQPYYGPGYKLDFPATAGNCAACHTPVAAVNAPYSTDPTQVSGVGAEGIACDFCHKVWNVYLSPSTGLPYANMPGVLSLEFRRPPGEHQFFAGPYDDVAPGEDTYSPLQTQSTFCAACHFGTFWDTTVYNSFGEWLDSPYSDPEAGKTCQDCHMPPLGATRIANTEQAQDRDPATIFSHRMPGAADENLLQNTAELTLTAEQVSGQVIVSVDVTNTQAGHHIPTDSPLRQVFVVVTATDAQGNALALLDGPTLPDWAGDLQGAPGVYFAKILQEIWTEVTPTAAYWNPTRILEDTRLPALATNTSSYTFAVPAGAGTVTVEARLIFRRAFYDLMQQKGWDVPDILMEQARVDVQE